MVNDFELSSDPYCWSSRSDYEDIGKTAKEINKMLLNDVLDFTMIFTIVYLYSMVINAIGAIVYHSQGHIDHTKVSLDQDLIAKLIGNLL